MKKIMYSPEAWEREKATARLRARAKYHANKGNPEYVAAERERTSAICRRKRVLLGSIRRERGCLDCGRKDGLLHFDHRDDTTKLFEPTHGARHSMAKLLVEIAKCDVRCAACHVRRHAAKRNRTTQPPSDFVGEASR